MQKQLSPDVNVKYYNVLLNENFPITYFPYSQEHKEVGRLHYHDSFEIGLCIGGNGIFFIDNRVESYQQGDVSFLFPHQPHIAQSHSEAPSNWFFISVDLISLFADNAALINNLLLNQYSIPNILSPLQDEDLPSLINIIIHELDRNDDLNKPIIKDTLAAFVSKILRTKNTEALRPELNSDTFRQISPVLTYISYHYAENISVKKMASVCNLSETYFRTVFKNAIGYPPLSYLTNVRMKMAKALLQSTTLSIISISQNIGYSTLSSFNRTFKARFGITPTEYRSNYFL
jgi:AraC-type DNA-binding domain-containing proteins